jgi:CheY-like chemotaxis protein
MPRPDRGPRVLVADDDPLVRQLIMTILSSMGLSSQGAPDGQSALQEIESGRFGLVILDYTMPRKNGLEVIEELRSRGHAIPIILVSGSLTEEVRQSCSREAGLQILEKPFTVTSLKEAVSQAIGP